MKEVVLLGAGASMEAGVPGAFQMTERFVDLFEEQFKEPSLILKFAIGGLLFQQGAKGLNPLQGVNIEELFTAIQVLAKRTSADVSPFVSSWHPMLDELDRISAKRSSGSSIQRALYNRLSKDLESCLKDKSREIDKAIEDFIKAKINGQPVRSAPGKDIYKMLQDSFRALGTKSSHSPFARELETMVYGHGEELDGLVFERTLNAMMQLLVDIVYIRDKEKVKYLEPLFNIPINGSRTIVTLNYDNSIELAASNMNVQLDTGIESWSQTGEFLLNTTWSSVTLLKLHGSIDWALRNGETSIEKPFPYHIIKKVPYEEMMDKTHFPALIFGQRNKLTAEGPFLDLLRTFKSSLDESELLTVIGYSFRDEHVNEFIKQWLNGNVNRKLRLINGTRADKNKGNDFMNHLFQIGTSRIEDLSMNASEGIRLCYPSTELF